MRSGRMGRRRFPSTSTLLPVIICTLAAALSAPLFAESPLRVELSAELRPLVPDTPEPPTREQVVRLLLEEARFTLSGMIYGFDFVYTPSDPVRKVAESFDLKPVAELPWGDPRLTVIDTRTEEKQLFVRFAYRPADFQSMRLEGWHSSALAHATGLGTSSYLAGPSKGRPASVREAIKNAIREHVRQRVYNRPREIRGSLALLDAPRIIVQGGDYQATVRIALEVSKVVPYTVF
ncbi:hypothetical protein [Salinispira pacifica]